MSDILCPGIVGSVEETRRRSTILQINTANTSAGSTTSTQFKPPTQSAGTYDCVILWGDGSQDHITAYDDAALTHTYSSSGTYTVQIIGQFEGWKYGNGGDKLKLLSVDNWGSGFRLAVAGGHFYGCANLTSVATNLVWGSVTDLTNSFRDTGLTSWGIDFSASITTLFQCFLDSSLAGWTVDIPSNITNLQAAWQGNAITSWTGGGWSGVTVATNCLNGNTLNTTDYNGLLVEIEANNSNSSVSFHGGSSTHSGAGTTARTALINDHSWSITDGGAA